MRTLLLSVALLVGMQQVAAAAGASASCDPDIRTRMETVRRSYIDGMSGVASSSFSSRPGTFGDMACLDRFMKGDMDIFFRPTNLNSLLEQVVSFACDKIESEISKATGGSGGFDAISAFSDIGSSGLSIPSASPASLEPISLSRILR